MFSNSQNRRNRRRNGGASNFNNRLERRFGGKHKNMNILSATLGTATLVLLCASLAEPEWFELSGGKCCFTYMGLGMFFGKFFVGDLSCAMGGREDDPSWGQRPKSSDMSMCLNGKALTLLNVIIAFCFFAIISSLFSFVLDVLSPRKKPFWKAMKRYAIGYIFCVMNVATVVGFAYWASEEISEIQSNHKLYPGSKAEVLFGTGVYLVTAAGGLAILATASNLMRQYPTDEEEQAEQLLEAMEEMDDDLTGNSSNLGYEPDPPPAYVP